jgi:excisionase family DNA binding protein
MTVNEIAALLGVSRPSVYRMIRRGELVPYRVGERLRFRLEDVDAYLERSREPAP